MAKPNGNEAMSEEELNASIGMAKEIIREARRNTLIKLESLVRVFCEKNQISQTREARDMNFYISINHQNGDCQDLYFGGQKVGVIDWVEMEIYQV